MRTKFKILSILLVLINTSVFSQQNPAVTNPLVNPSPAIVGSPVTFSFNIGTAGLAIPGTNISQRMGFTLVLSTGVTPSNPDGISSVSGAILTYFDITYDAPTRTYSGIQKLNVAIPDATLPQITVTANAIANPISAVVNIQPNVVAITQNQPTSDDNASIDTPLPVTLTSFTAAKEGQTALLKWATTMETNSDRFEIQRSQNGKQWGMIGTKQSNGESSSLKSYNFTDSEPLDGENLYRLKMVDRDGTFAYSRIESVTFEGLTASFHPNPVAEKLVITAGDFSKVKNIQIYDASGKTVYKSAAAPSAEINVQNLSAGLYVVQVVRANGTVITHKIIKQ